MSYVAKVKVLKDPGQGSETAGKYEFLVLPRCGELLSVPTVRTDRYFRVVDVFHEAYPIGARDPERPADIPHEVHIYVRLDEGWYFNF